MSDAHLHPDKKPGEDPDLDDQHVQESSPQQSGNIDTGGGAFVSGVVNAHEFVGRDKTVITEETAYNVAGLPNPYLGLSAFTYADRAAFAGREDAVKQALAKLTTPGEQANLLFITGASGSGKSSYAQAGLLPALEEHYKQRNKQVARAVFRPSSNPIAMLADALSLLGLPELRPQELERFTPEEFNRYLAENTPQDQVNLLVIDQFEEAFTQSTPSGRAILFGLLAALPPFEAGRTHVLVTLRSDYLEELYEHKPLWDIFDRQRVELRAMSPEQLETAIQQPLWAAGFGEIGQSKRFDPALLEKLAEDAAADAAYLPLLQVTLQELWKGGSLTLGAYIGLADAIRRRAEAVYQYSDYELDKPQEERQPADRDAILNVCLDLVEVSLDDDPGRDVRRPRTTADLIENNARRKRLVDELVQARLLSASTESAETGPVERVDIIHESLIKNWDRLRGAIAEARQTLRRRAVFEQHKREWIAHERSDAYALSGVRLAEARELEAQGDIALRAPEAGAYLRRSNELAEAAQRLRVRNVSLVAAGLSLFLLVAIIAAGFAWGQTNRLEDEKSTSEARLVLAQQSESTAESEKALAVDARSTADAERIISEDARNTALAARERANTQAEISLSRQLAAQAQELLVTQPGELNLAALLSSESLRRHAEHTSTQAVSDVLQTLPKPISRMDHNGAVSVVAFSPDGKWVISGSDDGTARVWEADTGVEIARVNHDAGVSVVAFSPDGKRVISGGGSSIRVWEAATGVEISHANHFGGVTTAAFSPDGSLVISGGYDDTARVWEIDSGQEVAHLNHPNGVRSVAFSPDGKWLITGCNDGIARVWDASTRIELLRMIHGSVVKEAAFSPDGNFVLTIGAGTARVWEVATGQEVTHDMHESSVEAAAFSPDGSRVVSGSMDGDVRVWETATGTQVARMAHEGQVWSVSFNPNGNWVVTSSFDGTARVWEVVTGREVARMVFRNWVTKVVFSPDSRQVLAGSYDGTARVWDTATGQGVARFAHTSAMIAVAISPDGKWVASGSEDGSVRVWETATGMELTNITHEGRIDYILFSPDGKWVASEGDDNTTRVWEAATGKEIARITHERNGLVGEKSIAFSPDGMWVASASGSRALVWEAATGAEIASIDHAGIVRTLAFSPDGKRIFSGGGSTALVWEAATGMEIARMDHEDDVTAVAFSPDGKWVVSGSENGLVRVWEATTGVPVSQVIHSVESIAFSSAIRSVAFTPDGSWVVSGGDDGTVRVWEALTGVEVSRMTHAGPVTSVALSMDGKLVVSGSYDRTIRVWEAANGNEISRIVAEVVVLSIAFSPDGDWVVSGSWDGIAQVWLWRPEDLLELACSRLERNLSQTEWQQYLSDRPYRQTCPNLPPWD